MKLIAALYSRFLSPVPDIIIRWLSLKQFLGFICTFEADLVKQWHNFRISVERKSLGVA